MKGACRVVVLPSFLHTIDVRCLRERERKKKETNRVAGSNGFKIDGGWICLQWWGKFYSQSYSQRIKLVRVICYIIIIIANDYQRSILRIIVFAI